MTSIPEMTRRWQALQQDSTLWVDAIEETSDELEDVNKDTLYEGYDSDGKRLNSYVRPKYAQAKHEMNPLPGYGNPDLKLSGTFYKGFQVNIDGAQVTVSSEDPNQKKVAGLLKRYGSKIFGFMENDKMQEYRNKSLYPTIAKNIKEKTGAK